VANPFLVLGGIAVGITVATFGVLQVPGWVMAAQDASVVNDLASVRAAQAAAVSESGEYTDDLDGLGLTFTEGAAGAAMELTTAADGWCATKLSQSGVVHAASNRVPGTVTGANVHEAARAADCAPMPCPTTQWTGTYYNVIALSGRPLTSECLPVLDRLHSAAANSTPGVPGTNYSARFTRTIDDGPGTYNFTVNVDDGVRVWVDGDLVFERWLTSGDGNVARPFTAALGAGPHDVVVEYLNYLSLGRITLAYTVAP
jgi:hypothetical protein